MVYGQMTRMYPLWSYEQLAILQISVYIAKGDFFLEGQKERLIFVESAN